MGKDEIRRLYPGIFATYKKRGTPEERQYWYHRATGTRLPGQPGSPKFAKAYLAATEAKPKDAGTLAGLIRDFTTSPRFDKRRESTRKEYLRMLKAVEAKFGTMPVAALDSPRVRGKFIDWQEEVGRDRPREADNRLTVLSAALSYALDKGRIKRNPLAGFTRLYLSDRADIIWTESDIKTFMKAAPLELQRVMILALHTGQRYGDLIRLRWADYAGETFSLKQSKTRARVTILVSQALRRMLDESPRVGPYILTRDDGRPWFTASDDKALAKAWAAHMEACGLRPGGYADLPKGQKSEHLRSNDLRGTAVTLLSEAGNGVPQICAVTGHTLQSATRILERYLSMTPSLSKAAIIAFENSPATAFANRLQTGDQSAAAAGRKMEV